MRKINYIDDLKSYIKKSNISENDICIVGSAVLCDHNIRRNNDLDIAILPERRSAIKDEDIPNGVDISQEKYGWLGITDEDLINSDEYHYTNHGFKIVRPEICWSFKRGRRWDKDLEDIDKMADVFILSNNPNWDWNIFQYQYHPSGYNERGYPEEKNTDICTKLQNSIENNGINETVKKSVLISFEKIYNLPQKFLNNSKGELNKSSTSKDIHFIIWPPVEEYFDSIVSKLKLHFDITNRTNIDLEGEFNNFIEELYSCNDFTWQIELKKHLLEPYDTNIEVVECTLPDKSSDRYEEYIKEIKQDIRKNYYYYVEDDCYHNIIHGPDSLDEEEWIKKTLFKFTNEDKISN